MAPVSNCTKMPHCCALPTMTMKTLSVFLLTAVAVADGPSGVEAVVIPAVDGVAESVESAPPDVDPGARRAVGLALHEIDADRSAGRGGEGGPGTGHGDELASPRRRPHGPLQPGGVRGERQPTGQAARIQRPAHEFLRGSAVCHHAGGEDDVDSARWFGHRVTVRTRDDIWPRVFVSWVRWLCAWSSLGCALSRCARTAKPHN